LRADQNKYLFKVDPAANKLEIKLAVEDFFKVKVVKVNTMNYDGKKRRERTLHYGKKADWKRAVVTLKDGDKIDLE
jgi:large subunit ribosomal protein L23